jgi:phage baseplate assembly protein W
MVNFSFPNQIDSAELSKIKNNFALRDRANSEIRSKTEIPIYFDKLSTNDSLGKDTLKGLTYPLALDNQGGLSLSFGYDRIAQAIQEVLDTRIGERVGNPFLGINELLFETISEDVEAQSIRRQILAAVPYLSEQNLRVNLSIGEDGTCYVVVFYSVETTGRLVTVQTSFR